MVVRVDPTKCQGYGRCVEIASELFELDEWGYASARLEGDVPSTLVDAAREAVRECPAQAILSAGDAYGND